MAARRNKSPGESLRLQLSSVRLDCIEIHPNIDERLGRRDLLESTLCDFSQWQESGLLDVLLLANPPITVPDKSRTGMHWVIAGGHLLHGLELFLGPSILVPVLVVESARLGEVDLASIRAVHGLACWLGASIQSKANLTEWVKPMAGESSLPVAHLIEKALA
jgi:hypothetical protein